MTEFLFILGASDPEMSAIERLLTECRIPFAYATVDGVRVHPGNAYEADDCSVSCGEFLYSESRVFVECRPRASMKLMQGDNDTFIDHHSPGDPGYGQPPERFLEGSSIGQVFRFLAENRRLSAEAHLGFYDNGGQDSGISSEFELSDGWWLLTNFGPTSEWHQNRVPNDLALVAAADHCLAAAYAGKCPGVDPTALAAWRVKSRSEFQCKSCQTCGGAGRCSHPDDPDGNETSWPCPDCSESAIAAKVEAAKAKLLAASDLTLVSRCICGCDDDPEKVLNGCGCTDCSASGQECDDGYLEYAVDMRGQHVSELPEAASQLGICFVADGLPGRDGRVKIVCQSGTPDQIDAFMRYWVPSQGLVGVYGDPERGFAGAYLPTPVPA